MKLFFWLRESTHREKKMSSQSQLAYITPEEYLIFERKANGEIFAMAGASKKHNLIVGNAFAELHAQLKKRPCQVYSNDMRVKVSSTDLYTYPDIVVVCEKEQFDDNYKDTLLNPTLIIEVLSDSTEATDRGGSLNSIANWLLCWNMC